MKLADSGAGPAPGYDRNVFLNCPFDEEYQPVFRALVFAVHDCGFVARCALEAEDGGEIRIDKINRLIRGCRHGIHDISRTEPDSVNHLPRFNMPLELGLFLGARAFGTGSQRFKNCLILDRERFRYQKYCSDIAGQDVRSHESDPDCAVRAVRNWLAAFLSPSVLLPGSQKIFGAVRRIPGGSSRVVRVLAPGSQGLAVRRVAHTRAGVGAGESTVTRGARPAAASASRLMRPLSRLEG